MKRRLLLAALLASALCRPASAQQPDPGKEVIGSVKLTVYYGTNGDPAAAGPRAKDASVEITTRLAKEQKLKYSKYLELAKDHRMLYRSYQNWAEPFQPASDEIMLRFEPQSNLINNDTMRLDLELWLSRKKILKTDAALTYGKPLFILGPDWKGGRLILLVELSAEKGGKP
jgi:hypothetical protein